jgi:hypothetical protein
MDELKKKRLKWVEANQENGFEEGILRLLTDLYPDNAHFIYELLQNAEDTRAQLVRFTLRDTGIEFEHDGERLFTLANVESITSIGGSTKRDDPTSIGKFGVGFKAVFAYTSTPEIHSGEFHFHIHDLVVPETNGVTRPRMGERETRFTFPFDNPKKPSAQAVAEIEQVLRALGDNILLFLSHIRKIEYLLPDGSFGSLERIDHDGGRIEIRASHPGGTETISHWLRFHKDVEVLDEDAKLKTCRIAIAYRLVEEMDEKKGRTTWKIIPLDHGQVSIYFPAEKETSNLHFHLHAPFASTVARDSVRDCAANNQLRDHLAELVVESLSIIRDQGMLTVGFLAVLPNPMDNLFPFYESIRKAIVETFRDKQLTPMKMGGYAAAEDIFRGPARISEVINDDDLVLLLGDDYVSPMWVANPHQQNQREDRFLDSLKIDEWGWDKLAQAINWLYGGKKESVEQWISKKDDVWLMRFYALLGEACDSHAEYMYLSDLSIVRVETDQGNEHVIPSEVFFPQHEGTSPPSDIRFVKPAVYSTGRSEAQKKLAKSFLERIGVRPFDAKVDFELKLNHYNNHPDNVGSVYFKDLEQFIVYWQKNPTDAGLFRSSTFLLGVSGDGNLHWRNPTELCQDVPYLETGLAELTYIHEKYPLWKGYLDRLGESMLKDFTAFVEAVGVMHKLDIVLQSTWERGRCHLHEDYKGATRERNRTDLDYTIPHLKDYLVVRSIPCSRLIWDAITHADRSVAVAEYAPNSKFKPHSDDSQLVLYLKGHAWIPDKTGEFRKPQDMTKDDLRTDFLYDERNGLLSAIKFGENARKCSEEYQSLNQTAQYMGFNSADELEKWRKVKELGISPDELLAKHAQRQPASQPEESVPNPERRRKGVLERRENAPTRESITCERTIQPGAKPETLEARAYLRAKYMNPEGQLICQCCHEEMPFKVRDAHYFEAIQCVGGLNHHHFENRLALCPTCAAMYQHARETEDTDIHHRIVAHDAPDTVSFTEIPVKLAGREFELRFVGTHWFDLKTILSK